MPFLVDGTIGAFRAGHDEESAVLVIIELNLILKFKYLERKVFEITAYTTGFSRPYGSAHESV